MVQTRYQNRQHGIYLIDIPSIGVTEVTHEEMVDDTKQLVKYLTSLQPPFDSPGLLSLFRFLNERPYVLFEFPMLRKEVNRIIASFSIIFEERDDPEGFLQTEVLTEGAPVDDILRQCTIIEGLTRTIENL
jgi:hypothetical protein